MYFKLQPDTDFLEFFFELVCVHMILSAPNDHGDKHFIMYIGTLAQGISFDFRWLFSSSFTPDLP